MSGPDIFEIVGRWEDWLEVRGAATETIREYRAYLLNAGALRRKDPRWFSPDDVVAVLKSYADRGPAKGNMATSLKSFYRFAEARELCGNPTADVLVRPEPEKETASLDARQVRSLLRAAFRRDPRRGWTLALLYATGARIGSLVAVEPGDVSAASITFRVMKGRRGPHEVPLNRLARSAVLHLLALPPGPRPTLVGVGKGAVWQWVHQAAIAANVRVDGRPAWPHLLRSSAGTIGYEATLDELGVDSRTTSWLDTDAAVSASVPGPDPFPAPRWARRDAGGDPLGELRHVLALLRWARRSIASPSTSPVATPRKKAEPARSRSGSIRPRLPGVGLAKLPRPARPRPC